MQIDLHGFHPDDLDLEALVRQSWEMGEPELELIHGHGHNRLRYGVTFANTNTGYLGLSVRRVLRHSPELKPYVVRSSLDVRQTGATSIRLRPNPAPARERLDWSQIGEPSF